MVGLENMFEDHNKKEQEECKCEYPKLNLQTKKCDNCNLYVDIANQLNISNVNGTLDLTPNDVEVFFNEIMNPKEPNENFKKAMLKLKNKIQQ